jgi:NAD+ synthase
VLELPPVATGLLAETLEKFLAEELRASGLAGYVVGLSGGVDSAVSAALAATAVGRERVLALALPGPTSAPESLRDAQTVAEALGLTLETVQLGPAAELLASTLGARDDRLRFGNLLARLRMVALFDRARTVPALVLGTSNKSEILLGYSTLFGDAAASVQPLGDVWKTHIFQLGRALGLPESVVGKAPTADLWPGQTDATPPWTRFSTGTTRAGWIGRGSSRPGSPLLSWTGRSVPTGATGSSGDPPWWPGSPRAA